MAALVSLSLGLIGLVPLTLIPVASAMAGTYHVYACRTPSGAAAPADGWSGSVKGAYDDYAINTCAAGGALTAALGDVTTHIADLDQATWTFSVPSGEAMTGATFWRSESADGGAAVLNATYESYLAGPSGGSVFDECVFAYGCPTGLGNPTQPFASVNRIAVPAANLGAHLYLNAACGGESGWECPAGWLKFDIVRTDAEGRYHGTYNFKFLGPGHYELRVLSEAEPDYLFAVGTSNVVLVRVIA